MRFTPPRSRGAYRIAQFVARLAVRALFRVHATGLDRLAAVDRPTIVAAVPHRNWVEPMVLLALMPGHLRTVLVADGPTIARSWIRRALVRLIGRVLPVWPKAGVSAFEAHMAVAKRALESGTLLVIFPETGPPAPPPRLRRISPSVAWFAAATGAQVLPICFGGTDELFLRRSIELRVLASIEPPGADGLVRRTELVRWVRDFREVCQSAAEDLDATANANSPRRKRWLWLTGNYPRAT